MTNHSNNCRPTTPFTIGITMDVVTTPEGRVKTDCSLAYAACVERAGAVPLMLPPLTASIPDQLRLCDGFILTGGDDPRMEHFGVPTHPRAKVIHPQRQEYELALLAELEKRSSTPVLGICLGMQLMALHRGGSLNQHLPDTLATHALHKQAEHDVYPVSGCALVGRGRVWSNHRQAVSDPGRLKVAARSDDGVIEAVFDPAHRFFVGVQWHPERTSDERMGQRILNDLVSSIPR